MPILIGAGAAIGWIAFLIINALLSDDSVADRMGATRLWPALVLLVGGIALNALKDYAKRV